MTSNNFMRLEFAAKSINEGFARTAIAAFAAQLDPTLEDIVELKTAVSEAVTNAIIHGYEGRGGVVTLTAEMIDNNTGISITVEDSGCGIEDIEQARRPLYTSQPDEGRAGMGFAVMETFMDTLTVTSAKNEGTKVCMTKKFKTE